MKFMSYLIILLAMTSICGAGEDSPWGINTHTPAADELDICNELGVGWIRVDFNWCNIEHSGKGQFNWAVHDEIVASASARGIRIFGTIAYTPSWASTTGQYNGVPLSQEDWYDFVYACVSRYSYWVRHWGMWNEPNLAEFWTGSSADYVSLILIPGYTAAKAANPECLILGPELSDENRVNALEFLAFVMGSAGSYIDIVTQHSYGTSSDVMGFIDNFLYPALQNQAPGKELWLTETGWRTDTDGEELQAVMYQQMCEDVQTRQYIKKVFFYHLSDGPETQKWGIIRYPDNSRKPAFSYYQSCISGSTPVPLASGCFIATAAYGTPLASEVRILSRFRDRHLLTNGPGRKFVRCYYRISPVIAGIISKSRFLRFMVRTGLRPLVFLCRKS